MGSSIGAADDAVGRLVVAKWFLGLHGEPLDHDCPVCESPRLVLLRHVFGHQLGQYSGRIRTVDELEEMEHQFGEFHVYEVEVCPDCLWNHILVDYVLGDGRRRRPPRHQPTVEDIYG